MTRSFWGGTLVVSLLVTGAAAFYVFHQVENKEIVSMVAVETPVEATPMPEPVAAPVAPAEATAAEPVAEKSNVKTEAPTKRNILFSLPRPNAKSVAIVGDFNNWKPTPLVKKDKKWQLSVALVPGTYKYMFVIDKKQTRDPNNKMVADGKSLITVKPLSTGK